MGFKNTYYRLGERTCNNEFETKDFGVRDGFCDFCTQCVRENKNSASRFNEIMICKFDSCKWWFRWWYSIIFKNFRRH